MQSMLDLSYGSVLSFAVASCIIYLTGAALYSIYFSPLRHIPGPWYCAVSRLPYIYKLLTGEPANFLRSLHSRYGDAVRYTPNEVSVISGETAWQDIYGFRTGKQKNTLPFNKDSRFYTNSGSMLNAPEGVHGRQRKVISHAFSDKALRTQEPLLQEYIDLLIQRLGESNNGEQEQYIDICEYLNWATFDIISDLVFGAPFGCLRDKKTHVYVSTLLRSLKSTVLFYVKNYLPALMPFTRLLLPGINRDDFAQMGVYTTAETDKRIAMPTDRPDFMTAILAHNNKSVEEGGLTNQEIYTNIRLLLTAGTETTATTLSVAVFQLSSNKEVLKKLQAEVRGAFDKYEDITSDTVLGLEYLTAVLHEGLRIMPPVPVGAVRRTPVGGAMVSGVFVPEDTGISVSQWPANRSPRNFRDPDKFAPERWLGEERYKDDERTVFQPFSFGPRNCLGKNLAYLELRLILAKMVWTYDWEMAEGYKDWDKKCNAYFLWAKPELMVKFTPVIR